MLGIFSRKKTDSAPEVRSLGTDLLELFGVVPAVSGIAVTPASAMRCAPLRCAVNTIAEAIGQLPIHLYRREADGSRERDTTHPLHALLTTAANEFTPASKFREAMTRDALLTDVGGVAMINRLQSGKVAELLRLTPGSVTVELDPLTGEPSYRLSQSAGNRLLSRHDVFHLEAPGGESMIRQGREAIALAIVLEQHAARLFANGGRPSGVLSFPSKLGAEVAKRIGTSWHNAHGGTASGKTAILEEGGDFKPLSFNSVDSQFIELRNYALGEISRISRVPPIFLSDYSRATWNNGETQGRALVDYCLMPWAVRWQSEIALKLLTKDERETHFAEFKFDALTKADLAARTDAYSKLIANRIMSPNEVRRLENLPPYPGGDKYENPAITTTTKTTGPAGAPDA